MQGKRSDAVAAKYENKMRLANFMALLLTHATQSKIANVNMKAYSSTFMALLLKWHWNWLSLNSGAQFVAVQEATNPAAQMKFCWRRWQD